MRNRQHCTPPFPPLTQDPPITVTNTPAFTAFRRRPYRQHDSNPKDRHRCLLHPDLLAVRLRSYAAEPVPRLPVQWLDDWQPGWVRAAACSVVWCAADRVWLKLKLVSGEWRFGSWWDSPPGAPAFLGLGHCIGFSNSEIKGICQLHVLRAHPQYIFCTFVFVTVVVHYRHCRYC